MARASSEAQRRFIRNVARLLPLSSALLVVPAWAVKWEITPTLVTEETYTDNLRLSPDGAKQGDWVTVLTPGVSVAGTGPRLRFAGTYGAQAVYRANEGTRDFNNLLSAVGNAELAQQLLFLDGRASISQQNVSVLGPQATSNINSTTNRTNVSTFYISPVLRHNFGTEMQGEARLGYSYVETSGASSADSGATTLDARLASGPAYKLMTWNAAYSREVINYSNSGRDTTLEKVSAGVRRLLTPTFAVLANVGYEDNNYVTASGAPKGESWSLGGEWVPSPRTSVTGTFGKRYYGDSYSLDASHRARLWTFSAGYSEDITSTRQQLALPTSASTAAYLEPLFLARFPDQFARQQAIQAFITQNGLPPNLIVPVDFFSNEFFLQKAWRASVAYTGARNTVVGNFFMSTRESQQTGVAAAGGAGDFAASSTVKQTGATASWSLRMSERDSSNVIVGYTRNETPGLAREDNVTYLRMSYNHQFEPGLAGALGFRRINSDSNQGGTGTYTENAVTATLRMSF